MATRKPPPKAQPEPPEMTPAELVSDYFEHQDEVNNVLKVFDVVSGDHIENLNMADHGPELCELIEQEVRALVPEGGRLILRTSKKSGFGWRHAAKCPLRPRLAIPPTHRMQEEPAPAGMGGLNIRELVSALKGGNGPDPSMVTELATLRANVVTKDADIARLSRDLARTEGELEAVKTERDKLRSLADPIELARKIDKAREEGVENGRKLEAMEHKAKDGQGGGLMESMTMDDVHKLIALVKEKQTDDAPALSIPPDVLESATLELLASVRDGDAPERTAQRLEPVGVGRATLIGPERVALMQAVANTAAWKTAIPSDTPGISAFADWIDQGAPLTPTPQPLVPVEGGTNAA